MQEKLLNWYHKNYRKLPWRDQYDPYKIWLSEIMLQQTQVATVIEYFNRFVKTFPTVYDLAQAEEDVVLKLWEGLGYYSRARRLIPCAKMVVEQYDGQFPEDYKEIIKLPGVGSYTAGAILSIAFNKKIPAVDGNVMRVYSRYFNMDADISHVKSKKTFEDKVLETLPEDRRHYNQALMELGARICTSKVYKCEVCPIQENCEAKRLGIQAIRPVKSKKIKKKHQNIAVCMIHSGGKILLMKRPPEGLLAGMWAFPTVAYTDQTDGVIKDFLDENYGLEVSGILSTCTTKHVYTHLVWDMTLFEMKTNQQLIIDLPQTKWVTLDELKNYALPKGFHKLLENRKKVEHQIRFC